MAVITVSRQLGSGGSEIARQVAAVLGFHLLDRELVDAVAQRAGAEPEAARSVDERAYAGAGGLVYSLLLTLQGHRLTPESYRYLAAAVIREAAARENLVILGRAAQVVLGRNVAAFHVHVVAPLADRVARLVARDGITAEEAQCRIQECDEARREYVWVLGHRDWADPRLYDLVVNTRRLSPEAAARLVVTAARQAGVVAAPARQPVAWTAGPALAVGTSPGAPG